MLAYELAVGKTESGDYVFESVPLGTFYVDGKQSKRKRNELSLVAYDKASFFDVAITDTIRNAAYANLYELVSAVCMYCNVGFAFTETEFLALPNASIVPDLKSEQLQSCADLIMWAAQTVACCAFINNLGVLNMKPYYFAADRKADRTVTARERMSISYSDTRTYLAYLTSYSTDDVKTYSKLIDYSAETDGPHIKEGAISFPKNPLLSALSAADCDTVNNAYLDNAAFPTRYIESKCFVDPAIELMDRLAFTGGTIDVDRRIVSVCTEIQWKYRNSGKLVCSNYEEYTGGVEETSTVSLLADDETSAQSETVYERVPPKSQIEKRIDAIEALLGMVGGDVYAVKTRDSATSTTHSQYWGAGELRAYMTPGGSVSGIALVDIVNALFGKLNFGSGEIELSAKNESGTESGLKIQFQSNGYKCYRITLYDEKYGYSEGIMIDYVDGALTIGKVGADGCRVQFGAGGVTYQNWNGKKYRILTEEIT